MFKKIKNILPIVLVAFLVPIPVLFWIPKGEVIAHGNTYPWPQVSGLLNIISYHLSSWSSSSGQNFDFVSSLFYLYATVVTFLGCNAHIGQLLFLYFGFLASFVGMFILTKKLGHSTIASVISGFFYLITPPVMSGMIIEPVNLKILPFYISSPILLYIFIKLVNERNYFKNLALLVIVTIFVCSPAYPSLQYFVLHLLLVAVYVLVDFLLAWKNKKLLLSHFIKAVSGFTLFILANSYWLFSLITNFNAAYIVRREIGYQDDHDWQMVNMTSSKIIDALRFLPYTLQVTVSPWLKFYYTPFITFLTFIFTGFVISALIPKRTRKLALLPFILLIISLFLEKGIREPLGIAGKVIFLSIPYITRLFRNLTYFNLLIAFSFSILIGLGVGEFIRLLFIKFRKYTLIKYFLILLVLASVIAYGWPYISGSLIKSQEETETSQTLNIPDSFIGLSRFITKEKTLSNFVEIPVFSTNGPFIVFDWNRTYSGTPFLSAWTNKFPISNTLKGTINPLISLVSYPTSDTVSPETWLRVLQHANTKNIIYYKDINWGYINKIYPNIKADAIELFVNNNPYINHVQDFGKTKEIQVYELDNKYYLPRFYIPTKTIGSSSDIEGLADILNLGDYATRSALFFNTDNTDMATDNADESADNTATADNTDEARRTLIGRADEIVIMGKLDNLVGQEELGMLSPVEIVLPSVKQNPGTLMYSLTLKKEEYGKWISRDDPNKLFNKHVFYASKRLAEYFKYASNLNEALTTRLVDQYQQEMVAALEQNITKHLNDYKKTLLAHEKKIAENGNSKIWEVAFSELEKKIDDLKMTKDFSQLVYTLQIPQSRDYQIFIDAGNATDSAKQWVNPDTRYFDQGEQKLTLPISGISQNLIGEDLKIASYTPDSLYRISFEYKSPKGSGFFISEGRPGAVAETNLPATGEEFVPFEMFFRSSPEAEEGAVHLSISAAEEKNMKVEKINQAKLMLRMRAESVDETRRARSIPKITFVKVNPTKYHVKVEGAKDPYSLVFSESYHQGWKAYVNAEGAESSTESTERYGQIVASYFDEDIKEGTHRNSFLDKYTFETWGKKPIPEKQHQLVNGYANSWYITPADSGGKENYEISIEFWPQRLFYLGLGISGTTLISCISYLLFAFIKRKR